jgi:hypothetical protein
MILAFLGQHVPGRVPGSIGSSATGQLVRDVLPNWFSQHGTNDAQRASGVFDRPGSKDDRLPVDGVGERGASLGAGEAGVGKSALLAARAAWQSTGHAGAQHCRECSLKPTCRLLVATAAAADPVRIELPPLSAR